MGPRLDPEPFPELALPEFSLTLREVSGREMQLSVSTGTTVAQLLQQVQQERDIKQHLVKLARGDSFLELRADATLGDLGIAEPTELTLLQRAPRVIQEPGQSQWNSDYVCEVLEIQEVGFGELTLGFKVRGDGSHGSLQDPSRS
ncbi:unnamed protein product, partial [Effrenium voratum]